MRELSRSRRLEDIPMLSHDLRRDEGILVLKPDGPLEAADFETLAAHVDAYLEQNGTLHGVLVQAKSFPGWDSLSALISHVKFVANHHRKIERIAVVTDAEVLKVLPRIADHFVKAEIRQFDAGQSELAMAWIEAA